MRGMRRLIAIAGSVLLAAAASGQSALQPSITYQGQLKFGGGPASGAFNLTFTLWDAAGSGSPPAGGTQIGLPVNMPATNVSDGLFNVILNEAGEFGAGAFTGDARWLQIAVNGTPLAPRQPLTAAPFAIYALNAPPAAGLWAAAGAAIHNTNAGDVGIGTSTPTARLHVSGGRGFFSDGLDIGAQNGASPYKLRVINETETAIFAKVEANSGSFAFGVYGQSDSASGGGGVFGIAPVYGVRGLAVATAGTAIGGDFTSDSVDGVGVFGHASADTGVNYAVRGHTDSPSGFSGYFEGRGYFSERVGIGTTAPAAPLHVTGGGDASPAGGGYVVIGDPAAGNVAIDQNEIMARNNGAVSDLFINHNGGNVAFLAGGGTGNIGVGTSTPTRGKVDIDVANQRAVYGSNNSVTFATAYFDNTGSGPAGVFDGGVTVIGSLSKSSGSFRIDHPLDPANKYLYHSFVESPDMKNLYDGIVITDDRGYATIEMPDWFEPLNREFRYQLTVIDDADSDEFVAAKIVRPLAARSFVIRTSRGNITVSWQVTGTRQDPWAEAHRIPVEEDKPLHERGKYQHPELYGLPKNMGIYSPPPPEESIQSATAKDGNEE